MDMDSTTADSLVNRDTPIPVVHIHPVDGASTTGHRLSHRLSATKLKDKLESLGENVHRESSSRMGDKMLNL